MTLPTVTQRYASSVFATSPMHVGEEEAVPLNRSSPQGDAAGLQASRQ